MKMGSRIDPWGIPHETVAEHKENSPITTEKDLSAKLS